MKIYNSVKLIELSDDFGKIHFTDAQAKCIGIAIGLVILGFMVYAIVQTVKAFQNKTNSPECETECEADFPSLTDTRAVVTKKGTQLVHKGNSKTPSHELRFMILFTLENNETLLLKVPQEAFERIFENQIGTLVLQDGQFFDFSVD